MAVFCIILFLLVRVLYKQWGVSDLGMEAIKNLKMVETARNEAREIITKNLLHKFPILEQEFLRREKKIHFE
jgi:hypothetical protein